MHKFTHVQLRKIDIDKWCEGFRINMDPGLDYILNWIDSNAAWFRSAWNKSLCKNCQHWYNCGHQVLDGCELYTDDEEES